MAKLIDLKSSLYKMLSQLKNLNLVGNEVEGHAQEANDTVIEHISSDTSLNSPTLLEQSLDTFCDTDVESNPLKLKNQLHPATLCCYTRTNIKDAYNASSMPIYQCATFRQESATEMGEYDYTRSGNPSRSFVEQHLAKLMNADRALCLSSGMTALDVILRLVSSGEEIVAGDDVYGGTNRLLGLVNKLYQIKVHHIDTTSASEVELVLNEKTKLVLLETPTNPLIKIVNIPEICKVVREKAPNAIIVVDNTMMSPYLQKPLDLGADIVYHSGTKYLSGHHDLMCGVIGIKGKELGEKLFFVVNATGTGLAPFECFLLLRGVKTLSVRMDRQQASANTIALFLENKGFKVRYPGLKSHPGYELHSSMSTGAGAVLSFETGDIKLSERIVEATKIWTISVSFGCVNSLIRYFLLIVCLATCLMLLSQQKFEKRVNSQKI